MPGSITDVFSQASSGVAPLAGTLTAQKAIGASSLSVNAATGWATATNSSFWFKLYQATTVTTPQGTFYQPISGTETLWKGLVSGLTVNSLTLTSGTDQLYPIGSIVEPMLTSSQWDAMYSGLIAQHSQLDGSHTNVTAISVNTTGAGTFGGTLTANGAIAGITPAKFQNPYKFSAYASATTSLANGVFTKVQFATKEFDTGTNYDNTTNYRFTVPAGAAGLYKFSSTINLTSGGSGEAYIISLYKNGTEFKRGMQIITAGGGANSLTISPPAFQLAAADYIEVYAFNGTGAAKSVSSGQSMSYFGGELVSQT